MIKNYLKVAFRNFSKNKTHSFINVVGLSVGMAVAILIGLWLHDELAFDKYHKRYDRIVQVLAHSNIGDGLTTEASMPLPLTAELRNKYASDFKAIAAITTAEQTISYEDKAFLRIGCYTEPQFTDILSLEMLKGNPAGLQSQGAVLISESLAKVLFADADPINKVIKLNNSYTQQVAGVYKNMPGNTRFSNLDFIAPVDIIFPDRSVYSNWYSSSFQVYALLNTNAKTDVVSDKIKNVLYANNEDATKPALFLHPMHLWHLYEFKNGQLVAGRMQFVWLFGTIGVFVLLLACINFMNLSTARSEKRAKEVGIRKTIGSLRRQLIGQFLSESWLVVLVSFAVAMLLVQLATPWFNQVSGKQVTILWSNPMFWLLAFVFCFFTGLIAGSYPAIYLSSFKPIKVLKGTFRAGRFAAIPRKVMVVIQFSVSVTLIIGTIIVFRQIQFAKNRPVGYEREGLLSIPFFLPEETQLPAFRNELMQTGAVSTLSASSSPTTGIWSSADNLDWKGKDPNRQESFGTILIDPDFGDVTGWQMKEGRNFSAQLTTDSSCFIFNEAAIRQMGLKNPIGEMIKWHGKSWKLIGVVKDMVMRSPFDPITPAVFLMDNTERSFNVINLKISGKLATSDALAKIETVFKKFAPGAAFSYKFADDEYASKFAAEERIGKLATFFAALAIFISCLGLFGMASFVAEQRVKEIGVRKVLGASVYNVWSLLSKDFVWLVVISLLISVPVSYYFMSKWLMQYNYRADIAWWIFGVTGIGALMITLLTVSFQSLKAAIANPVRSLRSE